MASARIRRLIGMRLDLLRRSPVQLRQGVGSATEQSRPNRLATATFAWCSMSV